MVNNLFEIVEKLKKFHRKSFNRLIMWCSKIFLMEPEISEFSLKLSAKGTGCNIRPMHASAKLRI